MSANVAVFFPSLIWDFPFIGVHGHIFTRS